ncbi:Fe-S cluster biogenesis protein NfuA [Breznakibacter xylanolyticus]|uniref:Fe-S cluster biogenesis protein NfuA n=1 Tax=Breznakibacter xylanolyticus TaxID=990 RepID=A0A2W7NR94_9BACT|nr:NifU family protein [Breznakibacter xylanolyticus]MBN2744238.1 NifU family protein [Marinilabiliaceae bacterium]PZX20617.1 Fe-S cluster biogenesis protein NfuA [Breznakibacter xylanolyticus]
MTDPKSLIPAIEAALDTIRPYLISDGGNINLVDVTADLKVKVKLTGACHGCPMSLQTLRGGVETVIRNAVPQITEVVAV